MTDTNSGLTVEDGRKAGIYVLPMPITVNDRAYLEGVGIELGDFYRELEAGCDAVSSQPSPGISLLCGMRSLQPALMR